eukprot:PhM_4_TR15910/c0_g1_i2/m.21289
MALFCQKTHFTFFERREVKISIKTYRERETVFPLLLHLIFVYFEKTKPTLKMTTDESSPLGRSSMHRALQWKRFAVKIPTAVDSTLTSSNAESSNNAQQNNTTTNDDNEGGSPTDAITCLDIATRFAVFGTGHGALAMCLASDVHYDSLASSQTSTDNSTSPAQLTDTLLVSSVVHGSTEPVASVGLHRASNERYLVAVTASVLQIYATSDVLYNGSLVVLRRVSLTSPVTCVCWDTCPRKERVFYGDAIGRLAMCFVHDEATAPGTYLCQEPAQVDSVSMATSDSMLFVVTSQRCLAIDVASQVDGAEVTEEERRPPAVVPMGSKPLGSLGGCTPGNGIAYCARPKNRLWVTDARTGQVRSTQRYDELLEEVAFGGRMGVVDCAASEGWLWTTGTVASHLVVVNAETATATCVDTFLSPCRFRDIVTCDGVLYAVVVRGEGPVANEICVCDLQDLVGARRPPQSVADHNEKDILVASSRGEGVCCAALPRSPSSAGVTPRESPRGAKRRTVTVVRRRTVTRHVRVGDNGSRVVVATTPQLSEETNVTTAAPNDALPHNHKDGAESAADAITSPTAYASTPETTTPTTYGAPTPMDESNELSGSREPSCDASPPHQQQPQRGDDDVKQLSSPTGVSTDDRDAVTTMAMTDHGTACVDEPPPPPRSPSPSAVVNVDEIVAQFPAKTHRLYVMLRDLHVQEQHGVETARDVRSELSASVAESWIPDVVALADHTQLLHKLREGTAVVSVPWRSLVSLCMFYFEDSDNNDKTDRGLLEGMVTSGLFDRDDLQHLVCAMNKTHRTRHMDYLQRHILHPTCLPHPPTPPREFSALRVSHEIDSRLLEGDFEVFDFVVDHYRENVAVLLWYLPYMFVLSTVKAQNLALQLFPQVHHLNVADALNEDLHEYCRSVIVTPLTATSTTEATRASRAEGLRDAYLDYLFMLVVGHGAAELTQCVDGCFVTHYLTALARRHTEVEAAGDDRRAKQISDRIRDIVTDHATWLYNVDDVGKLFFETRCLMGLHLLGQAQRYYTPLLRENDMESLFGLLRLSGGGSNGRCSRDDDWLRLLQAAHEMDLEEGVGGSGVGEAATTSSHVDCVATMGIVILGSAPAVDLLERAFFH